MDAKLKSKWVKALLSGHYKQGPSYLRKDGLFCCLGVLREICDPGSDRARGIGYLDDGQLRKYGLTHTKQKQLGDLNDNEVPFPVIAGFINENL